MGYVIGIDLGTTFTAAAIARDGRAEIVTLGNVAPAIASVVLVRSDGEVLIGEAAERRAASEPTRTAREFKRRLGDPTPLLLGGTPYGAETLMAHLLRTVVDRVTAMQGAPPDHIAVCHPANYGPYKLDLLQQAVQIAGIGDVSFIPEPVAAAVHYASQERVEVGENIAVYDFGGGTFDAALLRKTPNEFEMLGSPEGLERLGGIDFDQAVFGHVERALGGVFDELDDDDATMTALSRLREECRDAKEALSADTDTQIAVMLPQVQTDVRLTRAEFEVLIRPRVVETTETLLRAVHNAGLSPQDISRVLLVGGSSRIPLVGQLVREATGRPVAVDAHPKHSVALGAALSAVTSAGEVAPVVAPTDATDATDGQPETQLEMPEPDSGSRRATWAVVAVLILVLMLAAGGALFALGRGAETPAASTVAAAVVATASVATTQASVAGGSTSTRASAPPSLPTGGGVLGGRMVSITSVRVQDDRYVVEFSTIGFTPGMGDGERHIHFFFSGGDPGGLIAGTNATGTYVDDASPSPFTGLSPRERPAGSPLLCAAVADANHQTASLSGNCVAAPG